MFERGYPLENRSYQSDGINYKFTGKQRDTETGYDYFGARYYDARIANWTTTDPLFGARISWNPYNYVLRNPLSLIDVNGLFDDYYVFNEDGIYQNEIIPSKEKGIAIRNHETKGYTKYQFNEPEKDDATMRQLIKEYGSKGVKLVFNKSQSDISKYMTDAGVYSHNSFYNRLFWAIYASRENMQMDFWGSYLGKEMADEGIDKKKYINKDNAGFYIFPSDMVAYNGMDAGNYLWGKAMKELGFNYPEIVIGSEVYSLIRDKQPDSEYDQAAIKAGFNSK